MCKATVQAALEEAGDADGCQVDLRGFSDLALLGEFLRRRRRAMASVGRRSVVNEQKLLGHLSDLLLGVIHPQSLW